MPKNILSIAVPMTVAQVVSRECPRKVINLALPDAPVITGTSREVFDYYGLNAEGIAKKKLKTVINCSDELVFEADEEALKHILHNLVANSIDAMEQGGTLTLEGALKDKKAGRVLIRCRDTGCGISAENMQNLFNPFFTTKEPGKGTGLGLSIVRHIAIIHNGTIKAESQLGKGSVFTLSIPIS